MAGPPSSPLRAALLPCVLLFGAMTNLTLVVPGLKELVVDELGGTVADAALFFTVEMAAYLVFAPVWGLLSDRTGRRRPLVIAGFAASGALYLSYLFIDSVPLLLALRFVQGAAAIAGWSTALAIVFDGADERTRPRLAGLAGASMILGVGLGAPFGGAASAASALARRCITAK
ncbi:MAG: MFS transporter, partial [Thermoanaerobaculia bacterium]|nr:MFS transporter [Thermoanaerobaculia bacterium]